MELTTKYFTTLAKAINEIQGTTDCTPWFANILVRQNWLYETSKPIAFRFPTVEIMTNVYKEVYGFDEITVRNLMVLLEEISDEALKIFKPKA